MPYIQPVPRKDWPDVLGAKDIAAITGIMGQNAAYEFLKEHGRPRGHGRGADGFVIDKEDLIEWIDGDRYWIEGYEKHFPPAKWEGDDIQPEIPVKVLVAPDPEGGELAYETLPDGRVVLHKATGAWLKRVKVSKFPAVLKNPPKWLK